MSNLIVHIALLINLILISIVDIKSKTIPNWTLIFFPVYFLIMFVFSKVPILSIILPIVIFFAFFLAVHFISRGGFGMGDVKLLGLIAGTLGIYKMIICVFFTCIFAMIVCIILLLKGRIERKTKIPFAPFITLGVLASLFFPVLI